MKLHRINHIWYNLDLIVSIQEKDKPGWKISDTEQQFVCTFANGTELIVNIEQGNKIINYLTSPETYSSPL